MMTMRKLPGLVAALLVGGGFLATPPLARANTYPAKIPLPACVEAADCIALGKVTALEEKTILAPPFPGATVKVEYRVAVVKIEDGLKGPRGLTQVRIAFQPPAPPPPPPRPGEPLVIGPRPFPRKDLAVGAEGCFLLKRQKDEDFYRLVDSNWNDYLGKRERDYDSRLALVKRSLRLLADPDASLKSKDTADRLLTASLLLHRHQAAAGPRAKAEPIEAGQSRLILEAIAGADWSRTDPSGDSITARGVFQQLRLTPRDGWHAPQQGPAQDVRVFLKEWDAAAQKWLKDNSATYRVQRWVSEKAEK